MARCAGSSASSAPSPEVDRRADPARPLRTEVEMAAIVVLGGGACGLATALLLNRDGHEVLVLERDAAPVPGSPDQAWEDWSRPGVAQFRLPHSLHARTAGILATELPDVCTALLAAGALRYDPLDNPPPPLGVLVRQADDDRFAAVTARRSTLEQVLGRAADDEPGLRVERGVHVQELIHPDVGRRRARDRGPHPHRPAHPRRPGGRRDGAPLAAAGVAEVGRPPAAAGGGRGLRVQLLQPVLPVPGRPAAGGPRCPEQPARPRLRGPPAP